MTYKKVSYIQKLDVPESKLNEYREAFNKFDRDGSGTISANEIYKIFKNYGNPIPRSEVEKLIKEVDTSGDGEINFQEFVSLMFKQESIQYEGTEKYEMFSNDLLRRINEFRRDPNILNNSLQKFLKGVERIMKNDKTYLNELTEFKDSLRSLKRCRPLERNEDLCKSAQNEMVKYCKNSRSYNKYQNFKTLKGIVPDFYIKKKASLLGCDGFDVEDVDSTICKLLLNKEDKYKKGREMILNDLFSQAGIYVTENEEDTYLILIFAEDKPGTEVRSVKKDKYVFTGKYLYEGAFPTTRSTNYRDLDNYKRIEVTVMSKPKMIYSYYHNPNSNWIEMISKANEDFEEIKKRNIPGYKEGHPYGKFTYLFFCAPIRPRRAMSAGKSTITWKCLSPSKIVRKSSKDLIGTTEIIYENRMTKTVPYKKNTGAYNSLVGKIARQTKK